MNIAIAQTRSIKGNITANTIKHKELIELAVANNAAAIFFPELSLTGYEPTLAAALATNADDPLFNGFQEISNTHRITIGLGMPTKAAGGIHISMIVLQPNTPIQVYSKQQLHEDETPYFTSGKEQIMLQVQQQKIAPAICYESLQWSHSENAHQLGAAIYIASVAKPQRGIDKAMLHFPAVARRFSMPVFMANGVGPCDDFISAGQSAVWTKSGALAGQLDDQNEGVLIFDTEKEITTGIVYDDTK